MFAKFRVNSVDIVTRLRARCSKQCVRMA